MICSERERLTEEYPACVERFREVVLALKNLNGAELDRTYGTVKNVGSLWTMLVLL
jgi:hypothetical protein